MKGFGFGPASMSPRNPTIYEQLDIIKRRLEKQRHTNEDLIELIQLVKMMATKLESVERLSKSAHDVTHPQGFRR